LNDFAGEKCKQMFFTQPVFHDMNFEVEGSKIPAHRALLVARCEVLAKMLDGRFIESEGGVLIGDTAEINFLAFLEYLYTAHAPIAQVDAVQLLTLAHRFGITRLITLCELFLTKVVERATAADITRAEIDVIGLMTLAQRHNAKQLAAFCLHFISANYVPMSKRAEFATLEGENKRYVEEHKWPPDAYFVKLTEYEAEVQRRKLVAEGKAPDHKAGAIPGARVAAVPAGGKGGDNKCTIM